MTVGVEVPPHLAEPLRRGDVVARDDHGVGSDGIKRTGEVFGVATDRHFSARQEVGSVEVELTALPIDEAGPDDVVAGGVATREVAVEVEDRVARTHEQHSSLQVAALALADQPLASDPTRQDERKRADREGDQDVTTSQFERGKVREDRHDSREHERRVEDTAVLLEARAEDAVVTSVEEESIHAQPATITAETSQ